MIIKYIAGTLDFKPNCKLELLEEQAKYMGMYLKILEINIKTYLTIMLQQSHLRMHLNERNILRMCQFLLLSA